MSSKSVSSISVSSNSVQKFMQQVKYIKRLKNAGNRNFVSLQQAASAQTHPNDVSNNIEILEQRLFLVLKQCHFQ